jgi:FAD/FMN-containing dehydrogenase
MIRKNDPGTIAPYLQDASNYSGGNAEEVVIPETVEELAKFLAQEKRPVTLAGAGTGLTASRIPQDGVIVSLEKLDEIGGLESGKITVGPAVTLKALNDYLFSTEWFYPPNPTETLASLGGTLATNASGSRSFKYGCTRDFVGEIECILIDGRKLNLKRGLKVSEPLCFEDGSALEFPKITYQSPDCKNSAGFYVHPEMDWLDLFIGSDGTLAVFTKIILQLLPRPEDFVSGILFFEKEEYCWELVAKIKSINDATIDPCSLEYFDTHSLIRLKNKYNNIPHNAKAALFFEQSIRNKNDYDEVLENWFDFLNAEGKSLDDSWFAQNPNDAQRFHDFRHQIPVIINEENSRAKRIKLGTDMAVPDKYFFPMMRFYRELLETSHVDYVMFGHLGDNHLHINLLPNASQTLLAQKIYDQIVEQVLQWGGTVSAEHGIGKLKKKYFAKMVGVTGLNDLKTLKQCLDPELRLNTGNIF